MCKPCDIVSVFTSEDHNIVAWASIEVWSHAIQDTIVQQKLLELNNKLK